MSADDDGTGIVDRYDAWMARAREAGRVWILVDHDDYNTVIEDPGADRDLHLFFLTEDDAASEASGTTASPMSLGELADICARIAERGEGLALHNGERWIVAEPDLVTESLADDV